MLGAATNGWPAARRSCDVRQRRVAMDAGGLAPGRCLSDQLIAERRQDARREDAAEDSRRPRGVSDGAGFVLDASALLAYLLAEPGGDVVRRQPRRGGSGHVCRQLGRGALAAGLGRRRSRPGRPTPGCWRTARRRAHGRCVDRQRRANDCAAAPDESPLGLSLDDRACLALAQRLELPVVTTDRAWGAASDRRGDSPRASVAGAALEPPSGLSSSGVMPRRRIFCVGRVRPPARVIAR